LFFEWPPKSPSFAYFIHTLCVWSCHHFFCGTGVWTQGFVLTTQALFCLSHTTSPFCSVYFGDGVWRTMCLGWPWTVVPLISTSQVTRIIGMRQWHLAVLLFGLLTQAGLVLQILLSQSPECWDDNHIMYIYHITYFNIYYTLWNISYCNTL
jgi:hypothetical protein